MIQKILGFCSFVFAILFLSLPVVAQSQMSNQEREQAKNMISGTLYFRVQVPVKNGKGFMGDYQKAILEISPTALNTERRLSIPLKKNEGIYWGYLPNTSVRDTTLEYDGTTVVVWSERVEPDTEVTIEFIDSRAQSRSATNPFGMMLHGESLPAVEFI